MQLIDRFITKNDCFRNNQSVADSRYAAFQKRGPAGLMLHSVGTPQPNARVFADNWNKSGIEVAVHAVLQADGTVYRCMPWNYRGWHAGGSANETHVGVEMAEPSQIRYTGGADFVCSDLDSARAQVKGCYDTAVELFALLCREYGLDPETSILSHAEGSARGIASGHADPEHLWRGLGLGYTMDGFRQAVAERLESAPWYRVRLTASSAVGQLGAYRSLQNAIDACIPGYGVYDEAGNRLYFNPLFCEEETDDMNRDQILNALGDSYIAVFDDLPEWAKPEVRQMLDLGLINAGTADGRDDIQMLMSDLRVAIVAYRAFRLLEGK